ncbi:MAG: carboxypeptidase-like regulatory domain-containing protein [Ginsengibacter sp.]
MTAAFAFFFFCESFTGISGNADKIITGQVTESATGQPLASVTVQLKGKNLATKTNAQGYFSITANETSIHIFQHTSLSMILTVTGLLILPI